MSGHHIAGMVAAIVLHVVLGAGVIWAEKSWGSGKEDPTKDAVLIEAAIMMKSTKNKQPQKEAPRNKTQRTATTDSNTKADEKKQKPSEKQLTPEEIIAQKMKERDGLSDDEVGGEDDPTVPGDFNGSEFGWARENRGHPWYQELVKDAYSGWQLPTLEKGEADVHGCVQINKDGQVVNFKICKSSQNANIDRSVELALQHLKKVRAREKKPVPPQLMREVTSQWRKIPFPVKNRE